MDVHRDFCEVAIVQGGEMRSAGRVETTPEMLELFAASLAPDDRVVLEITSNAAEIARILAPHVGQVVGVNPHDTTISHARAKTDRLDARALARLLAAGALSGVWMPDERTQAMRRRLARRSQLVRARTRAKNEIQAVLIRRLKGRPPVSDLFGVTGRRWLRELELPDEEHETIAGGLRHVDFLSGEITELEAVIAREARASPDVRRLMTVPGVSVITASTFIAAIGDIHRFRSARQLVGFLGLDLSVRQSGTAPARHGTITKQGSAVRHVLVEAAWIAVRSPGPLRAFYERVRARRGAQVAAVATARKLASLFWCLLTREQDYAYGQPSLTRHKIRTLELAAGAERRKGQPRTPGGNRNKTIRDAERALAQQAEHAYRQTITDWKASGPAKTGAGVTPGRASQRPSRGKAARQTTSP